MPLDTAHIQVARMPRLKYQGQQGGYDKEEEEEEEQEEEEKEKEEVKEEE